MISLKDQKLLSHVYNLAAKNLGGNKILIIGEIHSIYNHCQVN